MSSGLNKWKEPSLRTSEGKAGQGQNVSPDPSCRTASAFLPVPLWSKALGLCLLFPLGPFQVFLIFGQEWGYSWSKVPWLSLPLITSLGGSFPTKPALSFRPTQVPPGDPAAPRAVFQAQGMIVTRSPRQFVLTLQLEKPSECLETVQTLNRTR